ncbi:hypothetical protein C8Q74DRAFT_1318273 [Fomes fomentarius]|nr:hypothetical protein C8Q74DRAFT_1318273 [Fomes fomentarius]
MPSSFKHADTSPTNPPQDGGKLTSAYSALEDDPFAEPATANVEAIDMAKKVDGAYSSISGANRGFSGDTANTIQTNIATVKGYSTPVKTLYESGTMKVVRDGIKSFADSLPDLLKALDEIAKLHPFISIAVGAFRVAVELDLKRRDNDKKIAVLFVEMRDMMEALLQLRAIKDEETIGPDGTTVKARMLELVKQTADDIKSCANTCDTYSKKKLIVKVIKSSVWDSALKSFIDLFARRRKDFTFALSIHVGVGVDHANRQLKVIDEKIDIVIEFFTKFVSPEQQELATLIAKKGGPTVVMGNNTALQELLKFKPGFKTSLGKRIDREGAESKGVTEKDELEVVKEELFDSPELAIRKNLEIFERKFMVQQRELVDEVGKIVHHEGDRVIEAITSGPHERILDPDIHDVWKEMRWPGHVKARHFVLALRDYYYQEMEKNKRARCDGEEVRATRLNFEDEWALEYIYINRIQAIAEAFDDDGSGFITIAEVNEFTCSRPKSWSLPQWLAYWAIGWQMTAAQYTRGICHICAKMFAIRPLIHTANRQAVMKYLDTVWLDITTLTHSLASYVGAEEQRLREGLETFRYDIDALDTLQLITGPGRIEKIFGVARTKVLHEDELWDSANTIWHLLRTVQERHDNSEAVFKQQGLDPKQQFKNFASELFDYWHDSSVFWGLSNLRQMRFLEVDCNDTEEDHSIPIGKLLNYPSAAEELYPIRDDILTEIDSQADEPVRLILGRWYGFLGANTWPHGGMRTWCFHASAERNVYEASDISWRGVSFTVFGGHTTDSDGTVVYHFSAVFTGRVASTFHFRVTLDEDGTTLSGMWGTSEDHLVYEFWLKRTRPDILVARLPPADFRENKVGALWKYALTYAHNHARRRLWSWSYFKQRRDLQTKYLELLERALDNDDAEGWSRGVMCDHCGDEIRGARVVCMECGTRSTFDFCDNPECVGAVVGTRDDITSPHLPTHPMFKARTECHDFHDMGKILRTAESGLARAKKLLDGASTSPHQSEEGQKAGLKTKLLRDGDMSHLTVSDSEQEVPILVCLSCSAPVSQPCWYCIDCPEDANTFVCQKCDEEKGGITVDSAEGGHKATHTLVRCLKPESVSNDGEGADTTTMEKRVEALEREIVGLRERFDKLLEILTIGHSTAAGPSL